jgi:porin
MRFNLAGICLIMIVAGSAAGQDSPPPVTSNLIYDANGVSNLSGGGRRGSAYQGMLRWQTSVDGEHVLGWPDSSAFFNVMATHQAGPSILTGDAQGVSNMAAPPGVRLEEAWIQKNFLDGRLSVLAGRYDLNSEFYHLNTASLFFNSSFGIGAEFAQSGQGGPSIFPATAVGTRIAVKPAPNVVLRAAILDGVPVDRSGGGSAAFRGGDGLLLVYEMAWLSRPEPAASAQDHHLRIGRNAGLAPDQGKLAVGGWYYTAQFAELNAFDASGQPRRQRGSSGAYLVAERSLYQSSAQSQKVVSGFVQLGAADSRVNRFDGYFGAGLTVTGLVPGRASDELGLAVAIARNGSAYLRSQQIAGVVSQRAESTVELTYLSQVSSRLSLQPSLQYVMHPNTVTGVGNALTLQLRAEVVF